MKQFIRKVSAVGASVAMLGMTVGGAVADLSTLPAPFVEGGSYVSTALVTGSAADAAARTTLKSYFDGEATASAGAVGVAEGAGYDREFYYESEFNASTQFGNQVDDEKVTTLADSKIDWGDKSYDYRELINFTGGAEVSTSVNTTGMNELGGEPYVTFQGASVSYLYFFDDVFNESDTASQNLSSTSPLAITLLGKSVDISDISLTTADTITLKIADDYTFYEGDSMTVSGQAVTVGGIFDGSVEVTSEGDTKIISTGNSHDFGANTVKVDTIGYNSNNPELSKAILNIGAKVSDTVSDGEVFELFEDYDPDGDAPWEWEIGTKTGGAGSLKYVGATLRLAADDLDISDADANPDPIGVGDSFAFPGGYVAMEFTETTDTSYCKVDIANKEDFDVNTSAATNTNGADMDGFVFTGDQSNCFQIGGVDTGTVYAMKGNGANANASWDLWYQDSEGIRKNSTAITFNIDWDDTIMAVNYVNASDAANPNLNYINISKDTNADSRDTHIYLNVSNGFTHFGTTGDFDSGKLEVFYGFGPSTAAPRIDLSGRDYQALTMYGVKIGDTGSDIEADLDKDLVVLHVPNNRAQAVVTIAAGSDVVGGVAVEPALMDADSDLSAYSNLVLVGGPCVNSATAEWLGVPAGSCGDASGIAQDTGLIRLMESAGKTALIVAGWETEDTQRAASSVGSGLSGDELLV